MKIKKFLTITSDLGSFKKKYIFIIFVTKPITKAFNLPIIGTLFCYAKNGIEFFKTPVAKFFYLIYSDVYYLSKNRVI